MHFSLFSTIIVVDLMDLFSISTDWGIPKDICSYIIYLEEFVFLTPLPYDIWKAYFRQLIPNGVLTEERDEVDIASEKEGSNKEGSESDHLEEGRARAHGDHFDCIKLGEDVADSPREANRQEVEIMDDNTRLTNGESESHEEKHVVKSCKPIEAREEDEAGHQVKSEGGSHCASPAGEEGDGVEKALAINSLEEGAGCNSLGLTP